jgi:hypothetical protein
MNWKRLTLILVLLVLLGEAVARWIVGLGDPPLYIADDSYEYIYKPKQDVLRFGNQILVNEFSMRSDPLNETDELRILKIGDSVINGGALTDHDSLASSMLQHHISHMTDKNVRVLNVSAGSWGPDNALAYLNKHGHFGSRLIVMVFSSHDLHDHMNFEEVVGHYESYPGSKPVSALWEGFARYFLPKIGFGVYAPKYPVNDKMNPGWQGLLDYCTLNKVPLLAVLHPTLEELESGTYDDRGQQLIRFLDANKVPLILELPTATKEMYRDNIHYNNSGQRHLFDQLKKPLIRFANKGIVVP